MLLRTTHWGSGDRVAVLVHGLLGAAGQFHAIGPMLADRGFRVVAVDLPGHGQSPPDPHATLQSAAEALVESVPTEPDVVIAHDLGATVVVLASDRLRPQRAVYVDVPFEPPAVLPVDLPELRAALTEQLAIAKIGRSLDNLRASRPAWSDDDRRAEAEAARLFDIPTAVSLTLNAAAGDAPAPPNTSIPSLVVRADPSNTVSSRRARELEQLGFTVRSVPETDHIVWFRPREFMEALDGWL